MAFKVPLIRTSFHFMSIMLFAANLRLLRAQLSIPLPPSQASGTPSTNQPLSAPAAEDNPQEALPYPVAQVIEEKQQGTKVVIESTDPQTRTGSLYTLDKDVVITYGDRLNLS